MKRSIILVGSLLSLIAILFTTVSIYWAMEAYPGGTILNRSSVAYDWWNNYLSDLGRNNAWNRAPNALSNQLFNRGLYVAVLAMLALFSLYGLIAERKLEKRLSFIVSILSFGSALAYLGIAWFPLDVNYRLHTVFVRIGFISFWILSLVLATLIRRIEQFPNFYAWVMYGFAAAFLVQISIMLFGPRAWSSPEALTLQVTAQKMIVGLQLLVMGIQAIGLFFRGLKLKQIA